MKSGIHPNYIDCTVRCVCGNSFSTMSMKPEMKVEICNVCHPFYTGKQKLMDTEGRVVRFLRKYNRTEAAPS